MKQIEASVANEVWERQWRLSQLRDAYALMLDKLESISIARARRRNVLATGSTDGTAAVHLQELQQSIEETYFEYRQARVRASLFVPQQHLQIAYDLIKELRRIEKDNSWAEAHTEGKVLIEKVRKDLMTSQGCLRNI